MTLDSFLRRTPAYVAYRHRNRDKLRVLAYHEVDTPETFSEQLAYLKRHTHPIGLPELLRSLRTGMPLPDRSTLVTFDDGDRTIVDNALPALQKYELPAVAFVVTGGVTSSEPFWWEEVKQLFGHGDRPAGFRGTTPGQLITWLKMLPCSAMLEALNQLRATAGYPPLQARPRLQADHLGLLESNGVLIGNHSYSHLLLDRCSDDLVLEQIGEAHDRLTEWLGHEPEAFAYPNGNIDERARLALLAQGYKAAFLFDHRLEDRIPPDPLAISRLRVNASSSVDRLALILSGLHTDLLRLRGRL